jgi:hypothetical protein
MNKAPIAAIVMMMLMMIALPAAAQVKFDAVSMDPPYIQAGDDVKLFVKFHEGFVKREIYSTKVRNTESLPLGDNADTYYIARIKPKDEASTRYLLIKEGERNIGHLFPGETWTTEFDVHVADNAPATNFTVTFEVYRSTMNSTDTGEILFMKDIIVDVNGVPKFSINSDDMLNSGESKEFRVVVSNVGGGIAREVAINLNATAPLTVLKSSSVYVGDMEGGVFKNIVYELYIDSTAQPKAYTIPIEVKYTDREGVTQTVNKILGVKVQGAPSVMASLDSFDDATGGMSGKVTVSVANKGFVEAKFMSLTLTDTEQYTVTSKNSVYIGNLASDDFQSEDFKIMPKDGVKGKIPLKVTLTYTEENNNIVHSEDSELMLNVLSSDEYAKIHPTSNSTQQLMVFVVLIPAIIVGYIVLWLLFKIAGAITSFIDRKVFRRQ